MKKLLGKVDLRNNYAVYEENGPTRVDAVEPEKGAGQIRDPELNDRGLELRKRFIKTIKALERSSARVG